MMPDDPLTPDPPKCVRCSAPILDGELVLRDHGDWLHVRCRLVRASSERVRRSKDLAQQSRKLIEIGNEGIEASQRLHMLKIVERLASAARRQSYCFPCLAVQHSFNSWNCRCGARLRSSWSVAASREPVACVTRVSARTTFSSCAIRSSRFYARTPTTARRVRPRQSSSSSTGIQQGTASASAPILSAVGPIDTYSGTTDSGPPAAVRARPPTA
jgi:hypothetical protein